MVRSIRFIASLVALAAPIGVASSEEPSGAALGRSTLVVVDVEGGERESVRLAGRYGAPSWSGDGRSLVLNGGGKLWRRPADGGVLTEIASGGVGWIDVNHGESPDGKELAFTSEGTMFLMPAGGAAAPSRIGPGYFHAWSPDGRRIAFAADRGRGVDVFAIDAHGGREARLTSAPALDDAPQYAPDGRSIVFISDRGGSRDIWRMPAEGAGAGDAKAVRVTRDAAVEAAPHPSPDGRWLYYLAHPAGTPTNAVDRDVRLMRMPTAAATPAPAKAEQVARFVGGHGSVGSRPFSPDGRRFAYVAYDPPPAAVRIVLFTPSDLQPPAIAGARLAQTAEAAERFLFGEMRRWKYPPAVDRLFERRPDGGVAFVHVRGDRPASDPSYSDSRCEAEAVRKAAAGLGVDPAGQVWWVFVYLGDRPRRFGDWRGHGTSRDGGGAIVNLDTLPGEIRPDLDPASGFNGQVFVKGMIHELGHALGLPHIGPDPSLGRGNSLMGPNNDVYAARRLPKPDRCYLTEASAAMLWKHPAFTGAFEGRNLQPTVKLVDYRPRYDREADRIVLDGRLSSDAPAHSVVVLDDLGNPRDEYWRRGHAARIGPNGEFCVEIGGPARASGSLRIFFCFDDGMPTGDGRDYGDAGAIRKTYQFRDGGYRFGD